MAALVLVPDSKNPSAASADTVGAFLSIAGLGLMLWAIIEAPTKGWTSTEVLGVGIASLVVLAAFVGWEARSHHPMLNLGFFSDRRFSIAAAAELLGTFGLLGALFLLTQFLQFVLGLSPLQAGLRILPMAGVLVASAALSPLLARAVGVKLTVAAGLAAIAGALWQISAASTPVTTYGDILPGLLLVGLGAGLLIPTATNSVVGSVPQGDSGIGSAANAVALQVGGALGVAVIGSLLSTRYQDRITSALAGHHVPAAAAHDIVGSHRRSAGCCGEHRGNYRKATGAGSTRRLHEREPSGSGRRRTRRGRGCAPRACPSAITGDQTSSPISRTRPQRAETEPPPSTSSSDSAASVGVPTSVGPPS